jgi:hypothetical protein
MDVFSIAVGVVYFLYLAATKGLSALWSWLKAKWTAGKADLAALDPEFTALEQGIVQDLKTRVAVEKDVRRDQGAPAPLAAVAAPASATSALVAAAPVGAA